MKKILTILSVLTIVSPAFADDPVAPSAPTPVAGSPVSFGDNQPTGDALTAVKGGAPLYQLANSDPEIDNALTTSAYVKGAYNATIKAVNTVADSVNTVSSTVSGLSTSKQDTLSGSNVVDSGSGVNVTNVSANNGTITVTKSNVTSIPVGANDASTRANIWLDSAS